MICSRLGDRAFTVGLEAEEGIDSRRLSFHADAEWVTPAALSATANLADVVTELPVAEVPVAEALRAG